jgi:segregation and condensation protein B
LPKSASAPPAPVAAKPLSKPKKPKAAPTVAPEAIVVEPYRRSQPLKPHLYAKLIRRQRQPASTPALTAPTVTALAEVDINMDTKRIVEAILFAAKQPMTAKQVQQAFPEWEQPDLADIHAAITSICEDYQQRPIELKQVASGYRFQVRQELSHWVMRLFEEKPPKYSRALLETLAIIAYRQPVTRGDIEDIRGVSVSSSIIQTLLEREWIKVIAHKEVPGRPSLYATTKQFLDYFNLSALNELPTLQEIQELEQSSASTHTLTKVNREQQKTQQPLFAEKPE